MADLPKSESERVVGSTEKIPGKFQSRDEAVNFLRMSLDQVRQKRLACDVVVPNDHDATVHLQRKAFQVYLLTVGRTMGLAEALFKAGWLDEKAWKEFHQESLNTLAASITGHV